MQKKQLKFGSGSFGENESSAADQNGDTGDAIEGHNSSVTQKITILISLLRRNLVFFTLSDS
jgi:hypothetical protein